MGFIFCQTFSVFTKSARIAFNHAIAERDEHQLNRRSTTPSTIFGVLAAARVLQRRQTEPGRELPARAELCAIADRRDQRRRGDDTDTGDRYRYGKSRFCFMNAV